MAWEVDHSGVWRCPNCGKHVSVSEEHSCKPKPFFDGELITAVVGALALACCLPPIALLSGVVAGVDKVFEKTAPFGAMVALSFLVGFTVVLGLLIRFKRSIPVGIAIFILYWVAHFLNVIFYNWPGVKQGGGHNVATQVAKPQSVPTNPPAKAASGSQGLATPPTQSDPPPPLPRNSTPANPQVGWLVVKGQKSPGISAYLEVNEKRFAEWPNAKDELRFVMSVGSYRVVLRSRRKVNSRYEYYKYEFGKNIQVKNGVETPLAVGKVVPDPDGEAKWHQ